MDGTTTDRITRCEECPYSYPQWGKAQFVCAHDDAPGDACNDPAVLGKVLDALPAPPPDWCPLRAAPTLVVLEVN